MSRDADSLGAKNNGDDSRTTTSQQVGALCVVAADVVYAAAADWFQPQQARLKERKGKAAMEGEENGKKGKLCLTDQSLAIIDFT